MKILSNSMYLLLIDEEVICKTGELYLTSIQNRIIPKSKGVIQAGDKIIAYYPLTKEAKELDLPLLPNPFEVVDIEKLACKKYNIKEGINDYDERYYNSHNVAKAEAFVAGYKAAQSKQFSLEDMKKAMLHALSYGFALRSTALRTKEEVEGNFLSTKTDEKIIQSLSTQQLPKEFKPIMVCGRCLKPDDNDEDCWSAKECSRNTDFPDTFKTIINSEGKKELVGSYKY